MTGGASDHGRIPAALRAVIDRRIEGGLGVDRRDEAGSVAYLVGGRVFADAADDSVSFRLGRLIARAATGTAGTSISPRGPEWVRFAPTEIDRFALDRAVAWFDHALRRAREARDD
jgi:hypothetical protein